MNSRLSALLITLSASFLVTSFTSVSIALAAGTDWPFPTEPKPPAQPNPVYDVGSCKIITDGLIVLPGLAKDPKNTVQFGDTVKLTYQLVDSDAVLTAEFTGTTGMGKPNVQTIATKLSSSIGSDYQSFNYYAPKTTDELRSFTIEMEVTERTANDVATKALLSTLARSTAKDRAGKEFIRTTTARYRCDLKPL